MLNTRHEARERAMQFLFQRDFNPEDLETALFYFWHEKKTNSKSKTFTNALIYGVTNYMEELDQKIQKYAKNWDLKRMSAVDRNVMRIALYEMLFCSDIPPVVSINEAVEIAKTYSGEESGRFVNGILDRVRKDINRPARTSLTSKKPGPAREKT